MIIALHVIIAIASIIFSSITFIRPSLKKLNVSYALIAGTVASGTYLLVAYPSHMLQSCLMGLFYITIVTAATIAAHVKLVRVPEHIKQ